MRMATLPTCCRDELGPLPYDAVDLRLLLAGMHMREPFGHPERSPRASMRLLRGAPLL